MDSAHTVIKSTYQVQVYNILEKMIAHGKLKSGQRLIVSELAASLGVSRSPVREALIALSAENLVEKREPEGWIVSEVSVKDIIELYELRKLIEVHAGKEGCLKCSTEILDQLELLINDLDKTVEIEEYLEKNWKIHQLLVLSCGSRKFCEVFDWTMKTIRWCGHLIMEFGGRREQSASEHREILRGFLARDPELVEKSILNHICSIQNTFTSMGANKLFLKE